MDAKWNKIKLQLQQLDPALTDLLLPGATDADLETLEQVTGLKLPEPFRAFYRIHNGQALGHGIWGGEEFLSTQRIAEEWAIWKQLLDAGEFQEAIPEPDPGIKPHWWNPKWLPLTYDGAGNHDCLDLDPDLENDGQPTQVLRMWHDDADRYLVASSFTEWIDFYIDDLENNFFIYDPDLGLIDTEQDALGFDAPDF